MNYKLVYMLTLNIIKHQTGPINGKNVDDITHIQDLPREFNGLPVARAPKELGRRGLTNKSVIIHPSGLKLSKCPNGYLILCAEVGCGNIGSKNGMKCVKHAETYKYCRYPDCDKRSHFGLEHKKPLYCSGHKEEGMVDVVHNMCSAPNCGLLPYFGIKGGPAQYCSKHKSPEMIDVLHKRCIGPGCDRIPSFGIEGGPVQYCSEHRPVNMIDVKHKRCLAPECDIIPSFGVEGERPKYCGLHKLEGMVNVTSKRCLTPGCMILPSFGILGGSIQYCKQHKLAGMINVKERKCLFPQCLIRPCFGFPDGATEYCNRHKQEGMTNIRTKKCIFPECTVQARFAIPGQQAQYCSEHKPEGMINIKDKRCDFVDCMCKPSYSLLFSPVKSHCKEHASLNEYAYPKRNPVCYELRCHNPAVFIAPDDVTIYPVRCHEHKMPTDVELVQRVCPNCEELIHFPINQEHCMNCGEYRELMICSARETAVEYVLQSSNIDFVRDRRVSPNGSRHRPDFLIPTTFGFIIVEVDENQHNKHFQHDEEKRMKTIYHDIQGIAPKKQVLFIRYNPDKYDSECMIDDKRRLEYLLRVIMSMKHLPSLGVPLGYTKLFYDGFTGIPAIQPLALM